MPKDRISSRDLIREVAAFALTLSFALFFKWEAHDVIWGLWISSLVVGYSFIAFAIFSLCREEFHEESRNGRNSDLAKLFKSKVSGGLILLAFFTAHFCGFHYGHSIFLNAIFPLMPENRTYSGNFFITIATSLKLYWPIVLATFVSRLPEFSPNAVDKEDNIFFKPYANVIRMHFMIFVFMGLHASNIAHYAIYPLLACYFFPWSSVYRSLRGEHTGLKGDVEAHPDKPFDESSDDVFQERVQRKTRIISVTFVLVVVVAVSVSIWWTESNDPAKQSGAHSSEVVEIASDNRFIAYSNGTVLDTRTNLMWAAEDNRSDVNWKAAGRYCRKYRGGGYSDWRMPSREELAGLYDKNMGYMASHTGSNVHLTEFIRLSTASIWTSETHRSDAAIFFFLEGFTFWDDRSDGGYRRALPVRFNK